MSQLEVIARLKVRPGQFEGCRAQVGEMIRITREKDTHTLRYDWFLSPDKTQWEVHEAYPDEEGLLEHSEHIMEARNILFRDYAYDHCMTVYGPISPHLTELFNKHAGGVGKFTLIQGIDRSANI